MVWLYAHFQQIVVVWMPLSLYRPSVKKLDLLDWWRGWISCWWPSIAEKEEKPIVVAVQWEEKASTIHCCGPPGSRARPRCFYYCYMAQDELRMPGLVAFTSFEAPLPRRQWHVQWQLIRASAPSTITNFVVLSTTTRISSFIFVRPPVRKTNYLKTI